MRSWFYILNCSEIPPPPLSPHHPCSALGDLDISSRLLPAFDISHVIGNVISQTQICLPRVPLCLTLTHFFQIIGRYPFFAQVFQGRPLPQKCGLTHISLIPCSHLIGAISRLWSNYLFSYLTPSLDDQVDSKNIIYTVIFTLPDA